MLWVFAQLAVSSKGIVAKDGGVLGRGSIMAGDIAKEGLRELRESVARTASTVSSLTFTMLIVGVYLVVAAASVSDRQIVVGTNLALPLLQVHVPLNLFFAVAPIIFLAIYINNLIHVDALVRRHRAYQLEVQQLADEKERELLLLVPQTFIEASEEPAPLHWWRTVIVTLAWFTWLLAPLGILLFLQYEALRYQNLIISALQSFAIAAALVAYHLTQSHGVAGSCSVVTGGAHGQYSGRGVAASAGILAVLLSAAMLADLFLGNWLSAVRVTNSILVAQEPAPVIVAELLRSAGAGREPIAQDRALFDPRFTTRLELGERRLRSADFRGSVLPRVMLGGADLRDARLCLTDLRMAYLKGANLDRVEMSRNTRLHQADLSGAKLRGAVLWRADLRGANLRRADLAGADLTRADLRGTDLRGVDLRGASLWRASLEGADLRCIADDKDSPEENPGGKRCADLRGAALWGADFDGADLRGAILTTVDTAGQGRLSRSDQDTSLLLADLRDVRLVSASEEAPAFTAAKSQCFSTDEHHPALLEKLRTSADTIALPSTPPAHDQSWARETALRIRQVIGCDAAIRYGIIERALAGSENDMLTSGLAAMLLESLEASHCTWSSPDPATERVEPATQQRLRELASGGPAAES